MAPRAGTGEREGYATAVAELATKLARTLRRLDEVAQVPDPDGLDSLPSLQYRLHQSVELLAGIDPPSGSEDAHAELLAALEDARDLTGEVAASGDVSGLLHQWRGALFRVRLARSQLLLPRALPAPLRDELEVEETASLAPQLAALTLMLVAAVALVVGALLGPWPVWAAGVALVACAFLVYRF